MFSKSAQYYDELYGALGKDYEAEAEKVHKFVQKHKQTDGKHLLDVACGTGVHVAELSRYYKAQGIDLDKNMLKVARGKHPKIRFHWGNMIDFNLRRKFDIITCLFSSIGYVKTKANLHKAIRNMGTHLQHGGILLVEPWFTPEQWTVGRVSILEVDKPEIKIVRMSHSGQSRNISLLEFQYLVGTPNGLEHSVEHHELGLFTHEEYLKAFKSADLKVIHDKNGLDGRGLYIGLKAKGEHERS